MRHLMEYLQAEKGRELYHVCDGVDKVRRLGRFLMVGLSAYASWLGEQIEVPMDQIIAPEDKKDCPD